MKQHNATATDYCAEHRHSCYSATFSTWSHKIYARYIFYCATPCWRGICCRCVSVCVYHTPILYLNGCTARARFLHRGFPRLIIHCVLGTLGISKNKGTLLWNFVSNCELGNLATTRPVSPGAILTSAGLLLISPGADGERGQVLSTSTDDRRLLITLGVQFVLSAMVDWAWGEAASRGPTALADICVVRVYE